VKLQLQIEYEENEGRDGCSISLQRGNFFGGEWPTDMRLKSYNDEHGRLEIELEWDPEPVPS